MSNQTAIYRARIRALEQECPLARRELYAEMEPYLRSLFAGVGDWAAPQISRDHAEAEVRRLLARIAEVQPNDLADARPEQVA